MKAIKKSFFIFLAVLFAGGIYLFFIADDPGLYLIAQHSDTPSQIIKIMDDLKADPSLSLNDFEGLRARFVRKYSETNNADWQELANKAAIIISEKKSAENE